MRANADKLPFLVLNTPALEGGQKAGLLPALDIIFRFSLPIVLITRLLLPAHLHCNCRSCVVMAAAQVFHLESAVDSKWNTWAAALSPGNGHLGGGTPRKQPKCGGSSAGQ